MNSKLIYETPKWGMILLIIIASSMSLGFTWLGITYEKWAANESTWIAYFFYAVAFFSSVSVYRVISWKRIIFFKADLSGMFFSCSKLKKCDSEFLFVPWEAVRNIEMGEFVTEHGVSTGLSMEINISIEDRTQYFPENLLKGYVEWTRVGFTSAFINKEEAILKLNELQSKCMSGVFDLSAHEKQIDELSNSRKKEVVNNLRMFIIYALVMISWTYMFHSFGGESGMYYMVGIIPIVLSPLIYIFLKRYK